MSVIEAGTNAVQHGHKQDATKALRRPLHDLPGPRSRSRCAIPARASTLAARHRRRHLAGPPLRHARPRHLHHARVLRQRGVPVRAGRHAVPPGEAPDGGGAPRRRRLSGPCRASSRWTGASAASASRSAIRPAPSPPASRRSRCARAAEGAERVAERGRRARGRLHRGGHAAAALGRARRGRRVRRALRATGCARPPACRCTRTTSA